MLLVTFVAIVVVTRATSLPPPRLKHLDSGGIEITVQDVPGLKMHHVKYVIDGKLGYGAFYQTVDGKWQHRNKDAIYHVDKEIYYAMFGSVNDKLASREGNIEQDDTNAVVVMPPQRMRRAGHRVFRDDFNGPIDTGYWDYELSMYGGYNWEIQAYTNDPLNVYTKHGILYIKPTLTSDKFGESFLHTGTMDMNKLWGGCTNADRGGCVRHGSDQLLPPIMSGKLKSKDTIRFGRVEVRAMIPRGDWIWPAIWMLPRANKYGQWPRSGEIDLMESRGNVYALSPDGNDHGVSEVGSTLHWGPDAANNKFYTTHGERDDHSFPNEYHTYQLDWTVSHIIISVDDHEILRVGIPGGGFWQKGGFGGNNLWAGGTQAAPFDQAFYLILNVAVGGTSGFFQDSWRYNSPKPWRDDSTTELEDFWRNRHDWLPSWKGEDVAMKVDWVEIWQY